MVVNVSPGGACLCLSNLPPVDRGLAIRFTRDGQDHVLRSRIVWSQRCVATSDREKPGLTDNWLAGIQFSDGEIRVGDAPLDILRAGQITIGSLAEDPPGGALKKGGRTKEKAPAVIGLSEQSILNAKQAANDLVPLLARHFSDVRMVFTQDRFEVSASFRPLSELSQPEPRRPAFPAIEATRATPVPTTRKIEQAAIPVEPRKEPAGDRKRHLQYAVAGLAVIALGGSLAWERNRTDAGPAASRILSKIHGAPKWASALDRTLRDEWMAIQKRFQLPDMAMQSALRVLRSNDKYASGQLLHDLTRYPVEVGRAFSLLATAEPRAGNALDLGTLKSDLQALVVQGSRFPDEAPGGRYSSLQRELFANVVVLAVVEHLHRHQDEAGVSGILGALQSGRSRAG